MKIYRRNTGEKYTPFNHFDMQTQVIFNPDGGCKRANCTLTTLPNRVLFTDHLKRAVAHAARKNDQLAILFIDLDNFKQINDTLGHKGGDQLLKNVGDRLMKSVRSTDSIIRLSNDEPECVVARLGGDEFTILLTDISSIQEPARVSQRIRCKREIQHLMKKWGQVNEVGHGGQRPVG